MGKVSVLPVSFAVPVTPGVTFRVLSAVRLLLAEALGEDAFPAPAELLPLELLPHAATPPSESSPVMARAAIRGLECMVFLPLMTCRGVVRSRRVIRFEPTPGPPPKATCASNQAFGDREPPPGGVARRSGAAAARRGGLRRASKLARRGAPAGSRALGRAGRSRSPAGSVGCAACRQRTRRRDRRPRDRAGRRRAAPPGPDRAGRRPYVADPGPRGRRQRPAPGPREARWSGAAPGGGHQPVAADRVADRPRAPQHRPPAAAAQRRGRRRAL